MIELFLQILQRYGFGAMMSGFIAFILYYVLKWVKDNQELILKNFQERELKQIEVIKQQADVLKEHIKELKSHQNHARVYHLQDIKDHGILVQSLKEIEKALGRLNGYKKIDKEE